MIELIFLVPGFVFLLLWIREKDLRKHYQFMAGEWEKEAKTVIEVAKVLQKQKGETSHE